MYVYIYIYTHTYIHTYTGSGSCLGMGLVKPPPLISPPPFMITENVQVLNDDQDLKNFKLYESKFKNY